VATPNGWPRSWTTFWTTRPSSPADSPIEVSLTVQGAEAHGTELGLHISQQLPKRHGGRLWREASSDAGSVFAFALPLKK
jgi:signal transduction histidine kinase